MSDQLPCTSSSIDLNFIDRKGGTVLLYDSNQYTKKRDNKKGTSVWRCINHRKENCKGTLILQDSTATVKQKHTCSSSTADNIIAKSIHECKERVSSGIFPAVPTEFNKTVASLEDSGINIIKKIPKLSNIQGAFYRARNKSAGLDKINFKTVDEFQLPPKFNNFLMADYGYLDTRILIFATEDAKEKLRVLKSYYSDGTFKSCPKPFEQLYVIQGEVNRSDGVDYIVPLIYAFMNKKDTQTYITLFTLIKSCIPEWEPHKYKTDYELAAMNAITSVFPNVQLKGCFHHFSKAIWKKAKTLELTKSKVAKRVVALCGLLALLPRDAVAEGWCYIESDCPLNSNMDKFKNYMVEFWLQNESFVDVWCVSDELHRTTNNVEAWNNKLNKATKVKNPNIMHILTVLMEDASMYSVRMKQFENNCFTPDNQNTKIKEKNQWINYVLQQYINKEISVGLCLEKLRV